MAYNTDGNLAALNAYQREEDAYADAEDRIERLKQEFLDGCYSAIIEGNKEAVEVYEDWVSENPEVFTRLLREAQSSKKIDNELFMQLSDWCFDEYLGEDCTADDIDTSARSLGL